MDIGSINKENIQNFFQKHEKWQVDYLLRWWDEKNSYLDCLFMGASQWYLSEKEHLQLNIIPIAKNGLE